MNHPGAVASLDDNVRATNDEAAECKMSAVNLGYMKDPFLPFFVKKRVARRQPIMNRGYYVRVQFLSRTILNFLSKFEGKKQVVNLGCGFATDFFNFKAVGALGECVWFEVDFYEVVLKKIRNIVEEPELAKLVGLDSSRPLSSSEEETGQLNTLDYHLIACDLRESDKLFSLLERSSIDLSVPTLFVAECVLVYLSAQDSGHLLSKCVDGFERSFLVSYDPMHLGDRFGDVMESNLARRGCPLPGFSALPTLAAHIKHASDGGFRSVLAIDQNTMWETIEEKERRRISAIELFDEFEEWKLMLSHYAALVASNDPSVAAEALLPS